MKLTTKNYPPRAKARMAGVFEALEGFTSSFGQVFILTSLVVVGNPAATAANILAHQQKFWVGFTSSLLGVIFHIVWILLFYHLFKPVSRSISLLAAFVGILVCAMQAVTSLLYLAPFVVLESGHSGGAFTTGQLQSLAAQLFQLNEYAFEIDLAFFGLWCVLTGWLIFRSGFMPRILGVLLVIDGFGWMTYLVPPFANTIFPLIAIASGLAEIPLQLWLIIKGVNNQQWLERAGIVRN